MLLSTPMQTTDTVVMVEPRDFTFNPETASSNHFMQAGHEAPAAIQQKALREFAAMVTTLQQHELRVVGLGSPSSLILPDAVFPNNWFSTFIDQQERANWVFYPMLAPSRQAEVQPELLAATLQPFGITNQKCWDFRDLVQQHKALEGTGSVVFDHLTRTAFVSLSPRSDEFAAKEILTTLGYQTVLFRSYVKEHLIYHTNVVLAIGTRFAVLCAECIRDTEEQRRVLQALKETQREIILISTAQMQHMCANLLELHNIKQQPKIVLSTQAYQHFSATQKKQLESYGELICVAIPTIEHIGGGSARCMLAEIFY